MNKGLDSFMATVGEKLEKDSMKEKKLEDEDAS